MLNLPRWGVLLIDMLIAVISISTAYMLRFNFDVPRIEYRFIQVAIPLMLSIRTLSFFLFKTYKGIVFHTSIEDAKHIILAVSGGSLVFLIATPLASQFVDYHIIPYSIIIIDFVVTAFLMLSFRIAVKILYLELRNRKKDKKRVVIYGAGSAGITTKKALDRDVGARYTIHGYIDADKNLQGKRLLGVDVFAPAKLERLFQASQIDYLIFATKQLPVQEKQAIVEKALLNKVKVLHVPPVEHWINGEFSFRQIREIKIEDLLAREPIKLHKQNIERFLHQKTVLVTGAAGSIGSEIARQIARFGPANLILLDQAETPLHELELELNQIPGDLSFQVVIGDVRQREQLYRLFTDFRPEVVFHAAAYKHVPLMERHPGEAVMANVFGTQNVADLAAEFKVQSFVFVSTDKAVNPTSIMGATKRTAEMYIQHLQARTPARQTAFVTTRFGNVLGSNGSVIPLFQRQIERGGPITVTHPDMTRFFMTIPEACQLVLEAGAMGKGGEVFVFDMGKSIRILDLAKKMIQLSGLQAEKDIPIVFTGLRPGEKLYEEVLNDTEKNLPTHHEKIMIAQLEQNGKIPLSEKLIQLKKLVAINNTVEIVRLIKELVPEYKSNNSVFEALDADQGD